VSDTDGHPAPGRITGLGGIFFKSRDTSALAGWYRDVLGIGMEGWDGAMFPAGLPCQAPYQIWSPFAETTDYFAPSQASFMINFAVDDLDAFLAHLAEKGVEPVGRSEDDHGKFAWVMDPDGNKIELWQPPTG